MNITNHDVVVLGETVLGAVVAATLVRHGIDCVLIGKASYQPTGHSIVSRSALAELGQDDSADWRPIESITRTRLSEFDAVDAVYRSERLGDLATWLLIFDRTDLINRILASPNVPVIRAMKSRTVFDEVRAVGIQVARDRRHDARLIIAAGDSAAAAAAEIERSDEMRPEQFRLTIEIGWFEPASGPTTWTILDGFPLRPDAGFTTILRSPLGTFVAMTVRMRATIDFGESASNLIEQLIGHPLVRTGLPDREPDFTANRVGLSATLNPSIRLEPSQIDLDELSDLGSAIRLDRTIQVARAVASEISEAVVAGDLSATRLSRLTRTVRQTTANDLSSSDLLGQSAEAWLNTNPDRLFASLFK